MATQTIETPTETLIIEERPTGDGSGTARTVTSIPKPGSTAYIQADIEAKAAQALTANQAFLAVASPTNAQNAAQLKALTRQVNGLIRLTLRQLDSSADT